MSGLPAEDDGSRDDPLVGHNIVTCNAYQHDCDALRKAPTRIVTGVGAKSGQQIAGRGGAAVAARPFGALINVGRPVRGPYGGRPG